MFTNKLLIDTDAVHRLNKTQQIQMKTYNNKNI